MNEYFSDAIGAFNETEYTKKHQQEYYCTSCGAFFEMECCCEEMEDDDVPY